MEQRTPVSGAGEEDLRPRLLEYKGLLGNGHPSFVDARYYGNSTKALNSGGNRTCEVDLVGKDDCDLKSNNSSLQLYKIRGKLTDGHPGGAQLLHQGGISME